MYCAATHEGVRLLSCMRVGFIAFAGEASDELQVAAIGDTAVESTTDEHVAAEQSSMRNRLKPQDQVRS